MSTAYREEREVEDVAVLVAAIGVHGAVLVQQDLARFDRRRWPWVLEVAVELAKTGIRSADLRYGVEVVWDLVREFPDVEPLWCAEFVGHAAAISGLQGPGLLLVRELARVARRM